MLAILKKIACLLLTLFVFMPSGTVAPYEAKDSENIRLSAVVLSDVHMEGNNTERFKNYGNTIRGVGAVQNDALIFTGDNTMNGQNIEWLFFYGYLRRFVDVDTVLVSAGNHDFGNVSDAATYDELAPRYISYYNDMCGENIDRVYYSQVINGYYFIVLCSEANAENTLSIISDEQIAFLSGELAKAAADGKPAFVFNHNLVRGKNGSRSYAHFNITDNNEALTAALENSNTDVFYFSGHSHYGLSDSSVETFGRTTYINLPATGNGGNYYPDNEACGAVGIGCRLEVYDDSVVLRFRNFLEGAWIEGYDDIVIALS